MRKKIIAANWKMNMTQAESAQFVESFLRDVGEINDVEVVIIPPFTAIPKVSEALGRAHNIKLGAQNMYWEKSGAFTGEISAPLLRDLFVHYVVLGHSERRTLFGETDEMGLRGVGTRYSTRDFHATILQLLGLDQNRLWFLHNGRNEKLTDFGGAVIKEMLA